jgi:4-diphosphocytidyl-2C-methyl-D-erythritol kinase
MMSGSGSTMFAVLKEGADADALAGAAKEALDPTMWSWSGLTDGPST